MMPLALFALSGCLAVNSASGSIRAGDLAPAFSALAGVPADTAVGLAPAPGVTRVFHFPELRMLAARFHLDGPPAEEICVTRPVFPPDPDRLREAMRRALPDARIELVDYSRQPAPEGELEFPLTGLRAARSGAENAVLWVGDVRYAGSRRFGVWARAKVIVRVTRVLAAADLRRGKAVAADEVQVVERDEPFTAEAFAASLSDVIGRWPRLAIRAGSAIRPAELEAAKDVVRGDTVQVEVRNGEASLKLEAQAESSGAAGETILVRNPESHKCFRARVEGKGVVSVTVAGVNP